jgi:hypothetical protein
MSDEVPRPSMRLLISSEISAGLSCIAFSESAAAGFDAVCRWMDSPM